MSGHVGVEQERVALADLKSKLRSGQLTQGAVLAAISEVNAPDPDDVAAAKRRLIGAGFEIDGNPLCSEADDGTWISGWVWVPR